LGAVSTRYVTRDQIDQQLVLVVLLEGKTRQMEGRWKKTKELRKEGLSVLLSFAKKKEKKRKKSHTKTM
jgi:hypothetical protein